MMGGIMVPLILLPPALVDFKSSTFVHKVLQTSCDIVITFSIVCCCLFFVEFLDHPAQNMYHNSTPWKALWNYLFNECSLIPNGLRMKKLCLFYYGATICRRDFRTRSVERFYHNSSHRSPKFTILDALERRLDGALQYTIFSHGTSMIMVENLITTAALWTWWWSDRTIFFLGILHHLWLGQRNIQETLAKIDMVTYLFHLYLFWVWAW